MTDGDGVVERALSLASRAELVAVVAVVGALVGVGLASLADRALAPGAVLGALVGGVGGLLLARSSAADP